MKIYPPRKSYLWALFRNMHFAPAAIAVNTVLVARTASSYRCSKNLSVNATNSAHRKTKTEFSLPKLKQKGFLTLSHSLFSLEASKQSKTLIQEYYDLFASVASLLPLEVSKIQAQSAFCQARKEQKTSRRRTLHLLKALLQYKYSVPTISRPRSE